MFFLKHFFKYFDDFRLGEVLLNWRFFLFDEGFCGCRVLHFVELSKPEDLDCMRRCLRGQEIPFGGENS